jgi:hypothetical protein
MPCPVRDRAVDGAGFLVAQAIVPVPQVGGAVGVRNEEAKGRVGLMLLRGAIVLLARSGTACRAPTEETANANGTLSWVCDKHLQSSLR